MITEFGHFALILAFMVALLQSSLPLIGASLNRHGLMAFAMPAATAQFVLVLAAFGALTPPCAINTSLDQGRNSKGKRHRKAHISQI